MITLATLARMPEYAAVRTEMRETLGKMGSGAARDLLDHGAWDCWSKAILDWILDSPDRETHDNRIAALYLTIREWEDEQNQQEGRDKDAAGPA